MSEATGHLAGTLHRVLGLRPGGQALHGADQPLEADLVIVDEVSMLDAMLANQLIKAIAAGATCSWSAIPINCRAWAPATSWPISSVEAVPVRA